MIPSDAERRIPGWLRNYVSLFYVASYPLLIVLAVAFLDDIYVVQALTFLTINFVLALVFSGLRIPVHYQPLFYSIHLVYFLVYIAKAVIMPILGLNTPYVLATIRTIITVVGYSDTLTVITIGHLVLVLLFFFTRFRTPQTSFREHPGPFFSDSSAKIMLGVLLLWIVVSSVVMQAYGVALMGAEGVSLPFQLSGVLFYSRVIVVPLLLLFVVQGAIFKQRVGLFYASLLVYLLFALSEFLVRASKAPLLVMIVMFGFMYLLLRNRGVNLASMINTRLLAVVLVFAIVAFPVGDVYRNIRVENLGIDSFAQELGTYMESSQSHSGGNIVLVAVERVFHRLVGFTQAAAIVENREFPHDFSTLVKYGGFAGYYTKYFLGYDVPGHLSGPSLLGSMIILGGEFWFLCLFGYFFTVLLLWNLASRFVILETPVKCMIGYEFVTHLLSGSIEISAFRILLVFVFALIFDIFLRISGGQFSTVDSTN